MRKLFSSLKSLGPVGWQAIIMAAISGIFWFAWAFGCYQTVYLQTVGFSASAIGLLNAISSGVAIAAVSFWGMVSDKIGSLRKVLITVLLGSAVLYALVPVIPTDLSVSPLLFFCILPAINFFRSACAPFAENLLVRNSNELAMNYGVLRSSGSLLFMVGSFGISAWLPSLGVQHTFWLTGVFLIIPIILILFAREPAARTPVKASGGKKEKNSLNLGELFQNKAYVAFLVFGFLFYIANACEGNFIPYFMESIQVESNYYGVLLAVRALMEVPFLLLMVRLRRRLPLRVLVLGSALFMGLECLGLGLVAKSLPAMVVFAGFYGLGNGLFLGSSVNYVYELAPVHLKASAQAFFTSVGSVAGILGNLIGGVVFDAIGAKPFYLAVTGLYLLSMGVFIASFSTKKKASQLTTDKG